MLVGALTPFLIALFTNPPTKKSAHFTVAKIISHVSTSLCVILPCSLASVVSLGWIPFPSRPRVRAAEDFIFAKLLPVPGSMCITCLYGLVVIAYSWVVLPVLVLLSLSDAATALAPGEMALALVVLLVVVVAVLALGLKSCPLWLIGVFGWAIAQPVQLLLAFVAGVIFIPAALTLSGVCVCWGALFSKGPAASSWTADHVHPESKPFKLDEALQIGSNANPDTLRLLLPLAEADGLS